MVQERHSSVKGLFSTENGSIKKKVQERQSSVKISLSKGMVQEP